MWWDFMPVENPTSFRFQSQKSTIISSLRYASFETMIEGIFTEASGYLVPNMIRVEQHYNN